MEEDMRGRKRTGEDERNERNEGNDGTKGTRGTRGTRGTKGTGLARGQRVAEGVWEAVKNGGACCKIGIFSWSSVQF